MHFDEAREMKLQERGKTKEAKRAAAAAAAAAGTLSFVPQPPHKHYIRKANRTAIYIVLARTEPGHCFGTLGLNQVVATMHTPSVSPDQVGQRR
jgi:hypothetical protein